MPVNNELYIAGKSELKDFLKMGLWESEKVKRTEHVPSSVIEEIVEESELKVDEPGRIKLIIENLAFTIYDFRVEEQEKRFETSIKIMDSVKG